MIEILRVVNMVPAVITFNDAGGSKSVIVYLDYASNRLVPTEDVGPLEDFRRAVFDFIAKGRKPAAVPDIPRGGFDILSNRP